MRLPVLPFSQRRCQHPHRPPVVIPRRLRFLAGPAFQHPTQMLGLPLARFADAEALFDRLGNPLAPFDMPGNARLRSWQRSFQQHRELMAVPRCRQPRHRPGHARVRAPGSAGKGHRFAVQVSCLPAGSARSLPRFPRTSRRPKRP